MNATLERARAFLFGKGSYAFLLALPLVLVFAHRGVAVILLAMAIASATATGPWARLARLFSPPIDARAPGKAGAYSLAAFALWVLASSLWSPISGAWNLALIVGSAALAGFFAFEGVLARDEAALRTARRAFLWACLLALALFCFEAASDGYLRFNAPLIDHSRGRAKDIVALGRGLTALLPSLFVVGGFYALRAQQAAEKRRAIFLAAIAIIALAALFVSSGLTIAANTTGILAGLAAAGLAYVVGRRVVRLLVIAYVGALALAPALALLPAVDLARDFAGEAPDSWMQRLFVWRHAAQEALACLPFGCGADYARALSEKGVMIDVPGSALPLALTPTHPHNAFLQIWLELGIPGVAL
ncbi:MAG TPA: O-antigen ligase family protein, partial [Parvularculaceae bacterium]|nr:O-antigen ligase family protein [Parvularculaceae bacterium]